MPKKFFKKYMPDPNKIRESKYLKIFGTLLHDPNLWHFNRRSVSGGFALGLFNAFVPLPSQMALSAIGAIMLRVNLPIAVGTVWLTNPVTIPPMFYFAYLVGTWIMGTPARPFHFQLSYDWLVNELAAIWQPFLLGCFVTGTVSAIIGYSTVRGLWRLHLIQHLRRRRLKRMLREKERQS